MDHPITPAMLRAGVDAMRREGVSLDPFEPLPLDDGDGERIIIAVYTAMAAVRLHQA